MDRYLTACANDFCREAKRQTISAQDVMQAIKELEFGELEEPLREYLDQVYRYSTALHESKLFFVTYFVVFFSCCRRVLRDIEVVALFR